MVILQLGHSPLVLVGKLFAIIAIATRECKVVEEERV